MSIITVTFSPAFDVHCSITDFSLYREHLAQITSRDIGGKGVNISRVLTTNGTENTAVVVLGQENAKEFSTQLTDEGITHCDFVVPGRIRENITIHSNDGRETRISFPASFEESGLVTQIEEQLNELIGDGTFIAVTGRIPDGIPLLQIKQWIQRLKNFGARVVIDSRSFTKNDLIECRPWLIKPNEEEIEQYTGREQRSIEAALDTADQLHQRGIENVMISMGKQGAALACSGGRFVAVPPLISPKSTIGAGDSAIAGFLTGAQQGLSAEECLKLAVAFGTASCLTAGTKPPTPSAIAEIFAQTELKRK